MTRGTILLLTAALLPACGAGGPNSEGRWAGTIDTLESGVVVVHSPARGVWDDENAWRIEEELRIGSATEEGPELFGAVADFEVDALGRIYVLDNQASEVRVFDATGAHVRTFGRKGGGPGEFNGPIGLAWDADGNLWVADPRNARYAVFDTAGTYLTSHPRPINGLIMPWPGGIDTEGRLYDYGFGANGELVIRFDSLMQPADTFAVPRYEGAEFFTLRDEEGLPRVAAMVPFTPYLVHRVDPRGGLWFGVNDRYRIVRRRLDGDTLRIVEREFEPVPVTAADRDSAIARLEWFTQQGGRIDPSKIPDVKPVFSGLLVDDQGYLWAVPATNTADEGRVFDVFDPDGRYLGAVRSSVRFPSPSSVLIRGGVLYGITRDELDVPYVVRARIVGR